MAKTLKLPKRYHPDFRVPGRKPVGAVEIDWSHFLFKGRQASALRPDKAALVNDTPIAISPTATTEIIKNRAFVTADGDNTTGTIPKFSVGSTDRAFLVLANISAIDTWAEIVSYTVSNSDAGSRLGLGKNGSGSLFFQDNDSWQVDTGLPFRTGELVLYGCSIEPDGTHNIYQYSRTNGIETATGTGSLTSKDLEKINIGASFDSPASRSVTGDIFYSIVLDGAISLVEFKKLGLNPYQLLKPRNDPFYFVPSAGGTSPVTSDFTAQWSLLQAISGQSDIRWNLLQVAASDSTINWGLLEAVGQQSDTRWSMLASVGQGSGINWDLLAAVNASSSFSWDALAGVVADSGLEWSLLQGVGQNSTAQWSLLANVGQSADIQWNVNSSLTAVGNQVSLQWSLIAAINAQLSAHWDLLESVGVDQSHKWDLVEAVAKELSAEWDLLQGATSNLTVNWDSLAVTGQGVTLQYSLQSETVVIPKHLMVVLPEVRIMKIESENRIMRVL